MFAHQFAAHHVNDSYRKLIKDIENNDFTLLDPLHHYTSGMKAVFTQECFDGALKIRESLGGAGYSAWSGIPNLIEDYSPNVTFEGDNTVMAQ
jgi:acyl-CoA oxidase